MNRYQSPLENRYGDTEQKTQAMKLAEDISMYIHDKDKQSYSVNIPDTFTITEIAFVLNVIASLRLEQSESSAEITIPANGLREQVSGESIGVNTQLKTIRYEITLVPAIRAC